MNGDTAAATGAILLAVYATLALDAYSSLCSSPQTTELFAKDREATLMKYVYISDAAGLAIGVGGAVFSKSCWPLVGAAIVVGGMHLLYRHAANAGKTSGEAPA